MDVKPEEESSSANPEQQDVGCLHDSESEVFDRIAAKLIRSGLLLTALELHAELIERGKELSRLRDFFNDLSNFEKHYESAPNSRSPPLPMATATINRPPLDGSGHLSKSPSEKTFDSLDFTHYSDDDGNGLTSNRTDERVAVLEFELRKARQTINSLRASLTMSTTGGDNVDDQNFGDNLDQFEILLNQSQPPVVADSSDRQPQISTFSEPTLIRDYVSRGSADGDSCPGEDDHQNTIAITSANKSGITMESVPLESHPFSISSKSSLIIKPHEKRALNYLINEYLMDNGYKLTSITFCDENTEQDFDTWDDVGLNVARPPDLLRLYRNYWKSLQHRTSNASTLIRSNSNVTTVASQSQRNNSSDIPG